MNFDSEIKNKIKVLKSLKQELENLKEYQCGDHPSRILCITDLKNNYDINEEKLKRLEIQLNRFGKIKHIDKNQIRNFDYMLVQYYDLRHSKNAFNALNSKYSMKYGISKDVLNDREQNQGTLVVFNIDISVTNDELKKLFGKYGDIKEIRSTPNKKHHKFVEFYDIRHAQNALDNLNQFELKGRKLKIEPSRPGGIRQKLLKICSTELFFDENVFAFPPPDEMISILNDYLEKIELILENEFILKINNLTNFKELNTFIYNFNFGLLRNFKFLNTNFNYNNYFNRQNIKTINVEENSDFNYGNDSNYNEEFIINKEKKITIIEENLNSLKNDKKSTNYENFNYKENSILLKKKEEEIEDIRISIPKPTMIGEELSAKFKEETKVGTPHLTYDLDIKGIGYNSELEDVDENKTVLVIENIPMTISEFEIIEKIENVISCFYDQFFIWNQNEETYKILVRITNKMVVENFILTFNNIFLEDDQDDLCKVYQIKKQGKVFTQSLMKLTS